MRAAVLIALAACGDNRASDPNVATSGSRLHLVQYDYGDGAREVDTTRFYDAAREEYCTPLSWSDGVTRCTPAYTTTVFTTPECTEPVGQLSPSEPAPPYLLQEFWLAGTFLPSRLFETGAPVPEPAQTWLRRGSACDGPYPGTGWRYLALGAEVSHDELVRITHPEVATASRLQRQVLASSDGLYLIAGVRDGDTPCKPVPAPGAATTVCLPAEVGAAQYFHDAQCAEPELAVSAVDRVPSVLRFDDARTSCTSYYQVGAAVEAPPLFHRNGPSCVAIAAPVDNLYFVAGAPADLVTLDRERDPTPRRIHPITFASDDVRFGDVHLYDEELGTECRRVVLDGAWRCVPATFSVVTERFDSDTCLTVVPLVEMRTGACATRDTFAIDQDFAYRRIGPVHAGPLFHLSTGDRCLPYAPAEGFELHDVGPPLATSAFAAATVTTD